MAQEIPASMRAAFYRRFGPARDVIEIGDLPVPEPGHGELLVRVAASGVNPHDIKKRSGWLGVPMGRDAVIPHHDGAGAVAAAGPGAPESRIGERVFVFAAGAARPGEGSAAEYVAAPADTVLALPDHLSFAEGASLGVPSFTAYYAVLGDGPVTGQTVLVQGGAGAVGAVAVELARWNGATVIATVSSPEKAEIARDAGADHVVDYRREDVAAHVADITSGQGVDRIVEVDFGANVAVDAACLKINGTVASYSSTRVREPVLPYYGFALKGARLNLLQAGNMPAEIRKAGVRALGALLERGLLRPRLAPAFALSDTAAAHELLESGSAVGNVVVTIEAP